MSWLRIDDKFSRHPKVTALTHKERWIWLDLLCYCASYQNGGFVPDNCAEVISGATPKFLGKCGQLGLVNVVHGRLRIHDWHVYNGTVTERVEHYLIENPDASANDVQKAIGGNRELVLAEVKRLRQGGSDGTRLGGSEIGSESGTRARVPIPSPAVGEVFALPVGLEQKLWKDLVEAAGATTAEAIGKLERTIRANRCTERDVVCAIEAASGPGVLDRLAVALSELKKRSGERSAA